MFLDKNRVRIIEETIVTDRVIKFQHRFSTCTKAFITQLVVNQSRKSFRVNILVVAFRDYMNKAECVTCHWFASIVVYEVDMPSSVTDFWIVTNVDAGRIIVVVRITNLLLEEFLYILK